MSGEREGAPPGAGDERRGRLQRLSRAASRGADPERSRRPKARRQDATIRGGIVGITAVIVATALLTLVGALIALVITLIY